MKSNFPFGANLPSVAPALALRLPRKSFAAREAEVFAADGLVTLPLILPLLVLTPLFALVILGAAPDGFSAPVFPLAAKATAQVMAPGIAGIGEKRITASPKSPPGHGGNNKRFKSNILKKHRVNSASLILTES